MRNRPTRDFLLAKSLTDEKDLSIKQPRVVDVDKWLHEAGRYAEHIFHYGELVDDHLDQALAAAQSGVDAFDFVDDLGIKYNFQRRI